MRLDRGYAMSEPNFLPWWKKAADKQAEEAAAQFYSGAKNSMPGKDILFVILANYVGGNLAKRTGKNK
jgi:hypothetical protein